MTTPIPINLAFEDALLESLLLKLLPVQFATRTVYNRGGYGYLKRTINGFNRAARGTPFLVATDLDRYECPAELIADWLLSPRHHNLLVRVAVREAEAWVLADRDNFADFLGISSTRIPLDIEAEHDPKSLLIQLARASRKKQLREDLCPRQNSTSKVGPNYNARLGVFVTGDWNPDVARRNSRSLDRAIRCLDAFRPLWPNPE